MKIALGSNVFILSFYRAGNPGKVFGRITNGLGELYKKYQKVKNIKPEDYLEMIINNPAASSGVCCSQKVLYSGFNTFLTAPRGGVLNPSTRINSVNVTVNSITFQGAEA